MPRYYIHNGTDKEGPFEKDELRAKVIKPSSPVWREGMADWAPASSVEELKDLFSTPPPFSATAPPPPRTTADPLGRTSGQMQNDKKVGRVLQLIGLVGAIVIVGGLLFSWMSAPGSTMGSSYEEKVMTVEEIEIANPTRFLEASGTWNENFWGDKLKIHGTVTSSATVARYKDVVIQVTYYSETKTVLGTDRYVLYEFVPPHSTVKFEWKLNRPNNCKQMGWEVVDAVAAKQL